ncbi:MAG: sigma-70 family RNA polymerase sigma factor [Bacteroidales bacterium]|nr:sigma-70 family RNA polymerase sigma factor [Bacteroidales bacterium]
MTGQKHDLTEWVKAYTDEMFRWAAYKLSDDELARDVVQDTFMAAAEKLKDFRNESSPKTWLFSILNFKIIDVYRNKANKPVSAGLDSMSDFFDEDGSWHRNKRPQAWHDDDDNHLLDDDHFREVLKECLEALPEKWNACVKLKYLMDKKGDDICQELEITPTNYWQIMHRAKLNLRDCIDNNWFQH